jgi:hypothetical protein
MIKTGDKVRFTDDCKENFNKECERHDLYDEDLEWILDLEGTITNIRDDQSDVSSVYGDIDILVHFENGDNKCDFVWDYRCFGLEE